MNSRLEKFKAQIYDPRFCGPIWLRALLMRIPFVGNSEQKCTGCPLEFWIPWLIGFEWWELVELGLVKVNFGYLLSISQRTTPPFTSDTWSGLYDFRKFCIRTSVYFLSAWPELGSPQTWVAQVCPFIQMGPSMIKTQLLINGIDILKSNIKQSSI